MSDRTGAGTIALRGMRAYGHHGAAAGERERAQALDIDLELCVDLAAARRSDDLHDTLDYASVHARVLRIVRETSFALLERLGGEILTDLMREPRIASASVTLAKPNLLAGATPSVTVSATRDATAGG